MSLQERRTAFFIEYEGLSRYFLNFKMLIRGCVCVCGEGSWGWGWLKSTFITVPLLKLFKTPLFDNVRRKLKDHLKLEISFSYKMVDVN